MAAAAIPSTTIDDGRRLPPLPTDGGDDGEGADVVDCDASESDPSSLVDRAELVPIGMLTRDDEREMLSVMRRLSSDVGGRRRDVDVVVGGGGRDDDDDAVATTDARRRRRDATIVERLLERLAKEEECRQGNRRDDDIAKRAATIHNLAIRAWAYANVRGSAERAERVLRRLRVAHDVGERGRKVTTAAPGNARSSSSPRPDVYSFAYCYAAWYRESTFASAKVKAATTGDDDLRASSMPMRRAEGVLRSMKQVLMRNDDRVQSDRSSNMVEDVNLLLTMWSNTHVDLPELSETFLRFLADEGGGEKGGDVDLWLNTRSFNLVINGEFSPSIRNDMLIVQAIFFASNLTQLIGKLGRRAEGATKP